MMDDIVKFGDENVAGCKYAGNAADGSKSIKIAVNASDRVEAGKRAANGVSNDGA